MLLYCFSSDGTGYFVKVMDSRKPLLAQTLQASTRGVKIKRHFIFKHDKDPKHKSKSRRKNASLTEDPDWKYVWATQEGCAHEILSQPVFITSLCCLRNKHIHLGSKASFLSVPEQSLVIMLTAASCNGWTVSKSQWPVVGRLALAVPGLYCLT